MKKAVVVLLCLVILLLGLPMAGVYLFGTPFDRYLEFPPKSQFVSHAPFSWTAFLIYLSIIILAILPFATRALRARPAKGEQWREKNPFPVWGWMAMVFGIVFWALAWTRFNWFSPFQAHTFAPLWICFIITVNACCYKRTGSSLLTHHTRFFLFLFPSSGAFWWFFEYLNRFVQNWHYTGVNFGAFQYFVLATISFSTVLPAVVSVQQFVLSFGWINEGFERWVRFGQVSNTVVGGGLIMGAVALFFVGIIPNVLFPMLWVAPLIIMVSVQILTGQEHVFSGLARGDWRIPVSSAMAALICGWFWEMWNYWSLAKWHYTVPLVDRFHVFEMPILGYAGYLPFGIECVAIGGLIKGLCCPLEPASLARPREQR
ncbi:MAG: hypothetical protein JRI39_11215 [Deltaproteobacteria bacterium]|nr:hypothetical protein [Deltaproteobacteria bacterium]